MQSCDGKHTDLRHKAGVKHSTRCSRAHINKSLCPGVTSDTRNRPFWSHNSQNSSWYAYWSRFMSLLWCLQLILQQEASLHENLQSGQSAKMTTMLTFPVFLMVNKRVYHLNHRKIKTSGIPLLYLNQKPAVRSVVWRQAVSAHSQRHCNHRRVLLYDGLTLVSMPLSFFHPLTRQSPSVVRA